MDWKEKFFELYESGKYEDYQAALEIKKLNLPPKLYRYRSVTKDNLEYREREIVKGELYLSRSDELNDPFEGCALLHSGNPALYANKDTFVEFYNLQGKENEARAVFEDENWFENVNFSILENSEVQMSKAETKEKLKEAIQHGFERFNSDLSNTVRKMNRIACFTTNPKNLPMWNHYTCEHKGICLEYDTSLFDDVFFLNRLFPVKYVEELPDMTYLMAHRAHPKFTLFDLLSINKLEDWRYEDEWRMILNAGSFYGSIENTPSNYWSTGKSIKFILPSRVILGRNISEEYEEKIISYAALADMPVVKAICTEYGLDFTDV